MSPTNRLAAAQAINPDVAQALADRAEHLRQLGGREQEINAEFEQRSLVAELHRRQMGGASDGR
ncbi:hypothetical protein M2323_002747 [Rhodoblastus acidophilus]|uniref:hypothetical protein n=1 Tax=Rhodoblastus acidophilus TaxID=1074 RepID=UPI00222433E5|nr:hypothetical protein [Rhodoblastus acidophilus]MCW2284899.1 hypothetical protein [Rhodoblastus acidophilus]MCW2333811.1 hypothetical protein [Rhodoblastus acidophilus]